MYPHICDILIAYCLLSVVLVLCKVGDVCVCVGRGCIWAVWNARCVHECVGTFKFEGMCGGLYVDCVDFMMCVCEGGI